MNILLIDADSKIPNIPLMKIATHYKCKGYNIELVKLNLPYFPNKKKKEYIIKNKYDRIYCSVIFEGNKNYIKGKNIIFGGTGFDLSTSLPHYIEKLDNDYSIYPDNDISYGFITRGCIRKCSFCKVPKKEGYIHKVNNVKNIIKHKKVKFLDNNILAYNKHNKILKELIELNIKCQFNQGLDIRLINNINSDLLSNLNYLNEYIFVFDNIRYKNIIKDKLKILSWRKDFQFKFFVYIHPSMKLDETIKRIEWLKNNKCLPYIMRDISCWNSKYNKFYIDIAAYCNQPNLFKKITFEEFLNKRHSNIDRISKSLNLYNNKNGI
jgi:hypothetical protein